MIDDLGVSDYDAFRAYISGEAWPAQAALLKDSPWRSGRRSRFEPHVLLLFWYGVTVVWKTGRRTATQFSDPDHWDFLRRTVREFHPRTPELWLPEVAPRRHHYLHFRRHRLDPLLTELQATHEHVAAGQAIEVGLCDPAGPGSWTHPDKTRTLTADGKVITPLYRAKKGTKRVNRQTGEIRAVRHDPDAKLHKTGDKRWLFGSKFELLHVRGPERHARIVLSVDIVERAEGDTLLAMLDRVMPGVPGTQALAYDGGVHGVHTNEMLVRDGIVPVVPAPGSRSDDPPAPRLLETNGGVQLFTQLGALGVGHLTEDGEVAFERLCRRNVLRRRNADGTFRWYGEYETADGSRRFRVRLDQTAADKLRGFNRAEHLRPIAKGDPDFDALMGLRSDSESLNRYLEDSFFNGRAHSVGRTRQLVDLIGFATGVNAVAVYRAAKPQVPPKQATA